MKLSQIFFWLFLVSLPFNKRIIYQPQNAYIQGYFSYYLAVFLYVSDILLFICFICNIVENWGNLGQFGQVFKKSWFWLILVFILSGLIGWFHMQHPISLLALYSLIKLIELIMLISLISSIGRDVSLKVTALILYISAVFQGILAILQFHVQHGLGLTWLGEYIAPLGTGGLAMLDGPHGRILRAYGTFPHPNVLAAFLVIGLTIGYLIVSRGTSKIAGFWLLLGNFVLTLGIFVTFSRVTWLVAALITLIYLYNLFILTKSPKYWLILIPALVSCLTILIVWHGLLFLRISNITTSNSYIDRGTYNHIGLTIGKTHLLGTGIGNYIPTMEQMFHVQPWDYQPPHNIFIYVAATYGILGFLVFVYMLYRIFGSIWLARRSENEGGNSQPSDLRFVLLVLGFALLFMSLFDHFLVTIQQGQLLFALVLGLMLNYSSNHPERS